VGQAINLDGKDDFVLVDDKNAGEVGRSPFTLDGWVKTSASGFQPIVAKVGGTEDEDDEDDNDDGNRDRGYALFLKDGFLGLFLGTTDRKGVFIADGADAGGIAIADGNWHHVAAVVDREYAARSKLFVDGQVALQFDATPFAGDATSHARLRIGELDVGKSGQLRRHHHEKKAFFNGQLDELDLFRSALTPDMVASIFVAGSGGKFGSLGNLPTSAGLPPCIDLLGTRIAILPPASSVPLTALYNQVLADVAAGRIRHARQLARQIATEAEQSFDNTYLTVQFHAVAHQVDACLGVPPLGP
jgi:hypothetical protein